MRVHLRTAPPPRATKGSTQPAESMAAWLAGDVARFIKATVANLETTASALPAAATSAAEMDSKRVPLWQFKSFECACWLAHRLAKHRVTSRTSPTSYKVASSARNATPRSLWPAQEQTRMYWWEDSFSERLANAPQACLTVGTSGALASDTTHSNAEDSPMSTLFCSFNDSEFRAAAHSRRISTSSISEATARASKAPATMMGRRASGAELSPRSVDTAARTSAASSEQASEMIGGRPPSVTMAFRRAGSTARLHKAYAIHL
mmetsp:Transcript_11481/g.39805  ORF Transcript_11481/g.39805 Transcript_11481/m.39805 type:complete len:263 (-) Transcript_11481:759-1547(-)